MTNRTTQLNKETNLVGTLQTNLTPTQTDGIQIKFDRVLPNGEVIEEGIDIEDGMLIFGIGRTTGNYEFIAASGKTYNAGTGIVTLANGVIRGVPFKGSDPNTGDTSLRKGHSSAEPVECVSDHYLHAILYKILLGEEETGGQRWVVGRGADELMYYSVKDATTGIIDIFRRNPGDGTIDWSDDGGSSWNYLGAGTGHGTTANISQHLQVDGSADGPTDGDLLIGDTTSGEWVKQPVTGNIVLDESGFMFVSGVGGSAGATAVEVIQVCKGVTGNTTALNLNTMTAGSTSDAQSLHTHNNLIQEQKNGVNTWNPTALSQTLVINHNLGRVPKYVKIRALEDVTKATSDGNRSESYGTYNGSTYACVYVAYNSGNPPSNFAQSDTTSIIASYRSVSGSGSNNWKANISALTTTSFTLNVYAFSAQAATRFMWEVFG